LFQRWSVHASWEAVLARRARPWSALLEKLSPAIFPRQDEAHLKKATERLPDIGRKFEYFLNTGNLVSKYGLDMTQSTGFTLVAEKLNYSRCGGGAQRGSHHRSSEDTSVVTCRSRDGDWHAAAVF
jgi:hypothetical protein